MEAWAGNPTNLLTTPSCLIFHDPLLVHFHPDIYGPAGL